MFEQIVVKDLNNAKNPPVIINVIELANKVKAGQSQAKALQNAGLNPLAPGLYVFGFVLKANGLYIPNIQELKAKTHFPSFRNTRKVF